MLKKFVVKNYKNFKDEITIDFENIAGYQFNMDCLSEGIIGKMLIYGRNATGKTNLGKALLDIGLTMFGGTRYAGNGILLNADSIEDAAVFQYEFRFGDVDLGYKYSRLSNQELRDEELFIDGKSIFKCNFSSREYNFDNLDYIDAELKKITNKSEIKKIKNTNFELVRNIQEMSISNAVNSNTKLVNIENAINKVSAEYLYLYPPGIPLIVPGEVVNVKLVEQIKEYKNRNYEIVRYDKFKIVD